MKGSVCNKPDPESFNGFTFSVTLDTWIEDQGSSSVRMNQWLRLLIDVHDDHGDGEIIRESGSCFFLIYVSVNFLHVFYDA